MTDISNTIVHRRDAYSNALISNSLSLLQNLIKFNDARLQAVSFRNMYSEHGFEATISPSLEHVFHAFIVSLY